MYKKHNTIIAWFFQYKKVWYYFDISTGVENCNNDLIGRGDHFIFVSGLSREGSIPHNCLVTFRLEFRCSINIQ